MSTAWTDRSTSPRSAAVRTVDGSVEASSSAPLTIGEEKLLATSEARSASSSPVDSSRRKPRAARPSVTSAPRIWSPMSSGRGSSDGRQSDESRRHCAVPHRTSSPDVSAPAAAADAEQPAGREERTAQRRGVPRLRALASARPTCRPQGTERVDGVAGPPGGGLVGRAGQMGRREARRRRGEHRPEALGPEGDEEGRPGGRIVGQVLEIAQHRVDGVPVAVQEVAPAFGRQPAGDQPRVEHRALPIPAGDGWARIARERATDRRDEEPTGRGRGDRAGRGDTRPGDRPGARGPPPAPARPVRPTAARAR